jgi:hypothetical protein
MSRFPIAGVETWMPGKYASSLTRNDRTGGMSSRRERATPWQGAVAHGVESVGDRWVSARPRRR